MTNLEAIKGKVGYPLSDNAFILALTDRSLVSTDTYVIGNKQQLELAQADLIYTLVSSPNVTEGGYSVSLSDKKSLIELANGIYTKYGQSSPLKPTAKFVQRW
jgi:hypothetical protein